MAIRGLRLLVLHAVVNQADGLAYAPLPAASGLRPAARPLLHADQMRWAAVRLAATLETEEPSERLPYVLTGLPRSRFRGKAMGWLHKTRSWYVTAALYIALAAVVGRQMGNPLSKTQLAFRACAAAATSANVFISDRYHNPDLRLRAGRPDAYSAEAETWALRCDYVGISSVLTTQLWLWSSNMAWMHQLKLARDWPLDPAPQPAPVGSPLRPRSTALRHALVHGVDAGRCGQWSHDLCSRCAREGRCSAEGRPQCREGPDGRTVRRYAPPRTQRCLQPFVAVSECL
eukprot:3538233-Prymnesium_polylepis.1